MKVGNGGVTSTGVFSAGSMYTGQPFAPSLDSNLKTTDIEGEYSALRTRNINSSIGLLQSAIATLDSAIGSSVDASDVLARISGATYFGKPIFVAGSTIDDDAGNVVFDLGKVLDIVADGGDLNVLKKSLRQENDVLKNYLSILRDTVSSTDNISLDSDFLVSNAPLFAKSHDLSNLSAKIDSLLA